jgi:asparagine synthase (glutamine-hydrolysing)
MLPEAAKPRLVGAKLIKMGNLLVAESEGARYRSLVSAWQDPAILMAEDAKPGAVADLADDSVWPPMLLRRMMLADQRSYLPDDLLAKVDRASMAVSLEARVPLLDHRIVEFSWRIPRQMLVREKRGKWILRQVLYRMIPQSLVDRPKVGFTVPIEAWLRGPLSGWAGDLLAEARRRDMGALDWERVNLEWRRFAGGDGSSATGLWAVLQFVAWHARWC